MGDRAECFFLVVGMVIGAFVAVVALFPVKPNITKPEPNTTISADGDTVTIKSAGSITLHVKAKKTDVGIDIGDLTLAPGNEGYVMKWDKGSDHWRIEEAEIIRDGYDLTLDGEVAEDDLVDYPAKGEAYE